jgi:hypothetical protein
MEQNMDKKSDAEVKKDEVPTEKSVAEKDKKLERGSDRYPHGN